LTEAEELEGCEYHGIAGSSLDCQNAVLRLLQFRDRISKARILTHTNQHCLVLTTEVGDRIAIKSGFSSGYGSTGPSCFSATLQLLNSHGAEIDECEVEEALMERLDRSGLIVGDLDRVDASAPIRPSRWPEYVLERHQDQAHGGTLWREFPAVIPFAVIDARIMDLALSFWKSPDEKLLKAYRRLEDIVRKRTGLTEHGQKLFSQAFGVETAPLQWKKIDPGERTGRTQLFTATYMAHRNPRSHRELENRDVEQLAEFLLLNHLYRLEGEAQRVRKKPKQINQTISTGE
jgi:hypothetical protein